MGRQEEPQQGGADAEEDVGQRIVDERVRPAHAVFAGGLEDGDFDRLVMGAAGAGSQEHVEGQHDKPGYVEQATQRPHDVEDLDFLQGFQEFVFQGRLIGIEFTEHEALGNPGAPHRNDVEEDPGETDPEVHVGEGLRPQLGFPEAGGEPVEHPGGHEAVPAEGTGMDVADGPVRVMGNGVDLGDGHQGTLKGGHAIEGNPGDKELDHGIGAEFVPSPAEGEQAVEHAAPGRSPEHQGEGHPKVLQPDGQGGVEQMVGAGPDVDED